MQLDEAERGFSFRHDGPLDMRMGGDGRDRRRSRRAAAAKSELAELIRALGEERFARRVARAIVAARQRRRSAAPASWPTSCAARSRRREPGLDPATRTFQALRIAVNDELGELDRGLAAAERLLMPGGRLAVVSFHSLEDARVKNFLRRRSGTAPAARATRRRAPGGAGAELSGCCAAARYGPATAEIAAQPARPLGPAARRRAHRGAAVARRLPEARRR